MNNLMIFEGNNVEVFEYEGKVLFNPRHVGECLELGESSVRMAIKEMNERQVIKLRNSDVNSIDVRKLNNAGENFLTESGVYKLIFKSRKEKAEKFQDWVTDSVLPTIRKTGGYVSEDREEEFINKYFPSFSDEVKRGMVLDLHNQNKKFKEEIKELKPKAEYHDVVLQPGKLITTTDVAKDLGMSGTKLNKVLNELGIIYKQGKVWKLYSKYQDRVPEYCDYHINEFSQLLKWTEKGRQWIIELIEEGEVA